MSTTAVFIELLIIGIQSTIWIAFSLLGFGFIKIENIDLKLIKDFITIVIPVLFTICYTIGIIVDRFSDGLFTIIKAEDILFRVKFFSKIRNKVLNNKNDLADLEIRFKEEKLLEYCSYMRCRLRVMRSTTINCFLITISSTIYYIKINQNGFHEMSTYWQLLNILIWGLFMTVVSFFSTGLFEFGYNARIKQISKMLNLNE